MVLYQTQGRYNSAENLEMYKQNRILAETFPDNCQSKLLMKVGEKIRKI